MSYAALCPTVNVATADEAALILRKKIGLRLKGGPHGLMRCWLQFRERAGGSKEGITYEEFVRGLSKYDLILDESVSGELFDRMDDSGDGHIQIKEFVDNVMGRWPTDTNTIIDNHVQQGRNKGVNDQPLEMNADEALIALRKKIGLRLKGGPHGLMRCWVQFREKAGGTKEGITYDEFHRGLINYGLHLKESVSREMYNRMDSSGDGHIQITEFIDNVMGRWPADTNSIVDSHVKVGTGKNVFDAPLRLNAEEALGSLRRKIGQRLKGGPYGLQRCWMQFRERCGGSKEGIAYEEWCRGLKLYDLILDESVSRELFNRMDQNGDGSIHMREFVDNVMGRWSPDITSLPAHRPRTTHPRSQRPGSVPTGTGGRVPPLPGIGTQAATRRPTKKPGQLTMQELRKIESDPMTSISHKMPAASSALSALHRAMHTAENGAGRGTLSCRGAFAKTLARQGIVLTSAELTYVANSFGCGSSVPASSRTSSRAATARGPRGSKVSVASLYPGGGGGAVAPLLPEFAGPNSSDTLINYGAFIRHFMK